MIMFSDQQDAHIAEETSSPSVQQIHILPFAVQLQNIFPVELVAKRFPVDVPNMIVPNFNTQVNLSDLSINPEALVAQIHLEVRVSFPSEPRMFEIYFKLVGIFTYTKEYSPEMVQYFLQQGSLSVMLPSARELLLSLCTRLQIPMVVLPLVQLSPANIDRENTSQ
jgi:preprotein translocase subunit SecB